MRHVDIGSLATSTEQEVFDFIAHHLLAQGKKSFSKSDGVCAYHGPEGLSCAAGCLIPADMSTVMIEGMDWGECVSSGFAPKHHDCLIALLQDVHDEVPVDQWGAALRQLAHTRGLLWRI